MRRHLASGRASAALGLLVLMVGCSETPPPSATSPSASTAPPPSSASAAPAVSPPAGPAESVASPFRFEEVAKSAGIDFVQVSGMTPARHFPSANGSGAAFLDYDRDGKMDLYFASCNLLPLAEKPANSNRLYRNLGGGKFEDVTEKAGVGFRGFCHGVIAADLDNDGDTDLILCNLGSNVLYLNNGDGTFRDESVKAGIASPNWSSGGAVLDYDNDGDLDVYIANYGSWDIKTDGLRKCPDEKAEVRQYCSPRTITTVRHILYRNDVTKDGVPHFTDVTVSAGVGRTDGHGFGVVATDLNGDGKIDLYVANDQCPAFTFINKGDGTFRDDTLENGAAFDDNGQAQSGMGVDAEDADGDGKPEIIRTNFMEETTSYYMNLGDSQFLEQSAFVGLMAESKKWVKWGCGLVDFDNDGWPDVFITNGHVDDNHHLVGNPNLPYNEPPLLFRNIGGGAGGGRKFASVAKGAGAYMETGHVGRGAAFGDLDDDGLADIVVNHKDKPPGVLLNRSKTPNHWVRLELRGTRSNRDAIGARVQVVAEGQTITRQQKGGGSMESTNDPRLLIGVGAAREVKIVVKWPAGGPDTVIEHADVDRTHKLVEPDPRIAMPTK